MLNVANGTHSPSLVPPVMDRWMTSRAGAAVELVVQFRYQKLISPIPPGTAAVRMYDGWFVEGRRAESMSETVLLLK